MRSLLNFFIRFHAFFLFLLLELVSLFFLFRYNNFQQVKFLNSCNRISGSVYDKYSNIEHYFNLYAINKELANENADLKKFIENKEHVAINIDSLLNVKNDSARYGFISAKVINNSVNKQYNYITLNKGLKHGIKPEMGVINHEGVVGLVVNSSENFSTVLSLLNGRWSLSAKLKNSNHYGPLRWEGDNPYIAVLNEIPYHVVVEEDDEVVTSGYSAAFAEGLLIGKVIGVVHEEGDNFQSIKVQLAVDFKSLYFVNVINNTLKEEQQKIEAITINE